MKQRLLKYVFPIVCFVGLACGQAGAQERQLRGKVTDAESGEGLPGVNVLEQGSSNGTITDIDGNYAISTGSNSSFVFSFVGYVSQTIQPGARAVVDVALKLDVRSLSEVVVVGYGTQDKKEITSSVSSVKAEDFNSGTVNSPAQLLQGKVAGLNVVRPGGNPNGNFKIRLRGISTVGANAEPLIVIDGVIGGSLSTVDPSDIETIDVLKDGSAAAIYGTRGSSGVILITTKSGKSGKITAEYNGSIAVETVGRTIATMSPAEYRKVPGAKDLGANTDWLDVVTRTGYSDVHNLSLGGGTSSTTYRVSLNLRDVQGIGINSGFRQLNGRLNLTQKALNDKAVFTVNISSTTKEANFGDPNSFRYGIVANPTMPVYDNTNDSPTAGASYGGYAQRDIFDFFNPLAIAEQNIDNGKDTRLLASIRGEYSFLNNLKGALFYSRQWEAEARNYYSPIEAKFGGGRDRHGLASIGNFQEYNELFESTVNYDESFGDVNLALLGGYSFQEFFKEGHAMSGGNFLTNAFTYNNMGAALDFAEGRGEVRSYKNSNKLIAFFGRVNLNYKGTYFLSASAREEGASRFGVNNKWGLFPAVSAGVTLSNIFSIPMVSSLKLRASWGRTGNQPTSSYASISRLGRIGNFFNNGKYLPSYGPISNANPDLKWEIKDEFDIGVDFAMLDGRLSGTLDYYKRNTRDMILFVNVPVPPNLFREKLVNIGELENTGFEAAVSYAAYTNGDFSWTPGFNLSTFSTTVVSLTSGSLSFGNGGVLFRANMGSPGQNDTRLVRVKEGEKLGQLWGPVPAGGVNDKGSPLFKDLNGDGKFCSCDDDRTVVGNGLPTLTFGINNSFTYKNFDFNFFLRGAVGHEIYNSYRGFYENTQGTTVDNYNVVNTKYYDPTIKDAKVNSSHVEKGDYIKLDNATLGYTVGLKPGSPITNLRVYLSTQNPFVVTGYTGVDPEVRFVDSLDDDDEDNDDALSPGIERRVTYFTTRTFTFGINLGF